MAIKWATLYKYIKAEYARDALENQRLYLSDGKFFNDPFETIVIDRKNGDISHIEGLHILSLTNSFQNRLMWSHYAEFHKGICLTVKVPSHLVHPICYSSKRIYTDSNVDDIILHSKIVSKSNINCDFSLLSENAKIAYIKDKKWMYEKEYRIVFCQSDETGLISDQGKWYMSVKIKNVYLGVNFDKNPSTSQEDIRRICRDNNVKITNMALSDSDYSVKVKR